LKADLEEYRTYVHEGVWTILDGPFGTPCDAVDELDKHRASFNDGNYRID